MITQLDSEKTVDLYNEKYLKNQLTGIYLYKIYMEKCYYCQIIQEEWNKFLKNVDMLKINVVEIERTFLDKVINPKIKNISRYPTIMILKNNMNPEIFMDERTSTKLNRFVSHFIKKSRIGGNNKSKKNKRKQKKIQKTKKIKKRKTNNTK